MKPFRYPSSLYSDRSTRRSMTPVDTCTYFGTVTAYLPRTAEVNSRVSGGHFSNGPGTEQAKTKACEHSLRLRQGSTRASARARGMRGCRAWWLRPLQSTARRVFTIFYVVLLLLAVSASPAVATQDDVPLAYRRVPLAPLPTPLHPPLRTPPLRSPPHH